MKNVLSIILLLIFSGLVYADTFSVGGKLLNIPAPIGFSQVTPQMKFAYLATQQMVDPMNEQLAVYIAESDVPVAMLGGEGEYSFKRWYILKVGKEIKNIVVGSEEFTEFKGAVKRQNKEYLKDVEKQMPGLMEKFSKGMSKELDLDFALKLTQVVLLDPHYETDNAMAHSMYVNSEIAMEGEKEDFIISATATYVNVAGKILFLYCYGPQKDIEWTRNTSKAWADMIMASNAQPPSYSPNRHGIDWFKVFEKAISGAIGGGLIGLIFGVFLGLKRRKD